MVCALRRAANPSAVHFYSSSGGNAGLACVHAANFVGRPSTVVVPLTTSLDMVARIRAAGASEVIQMGASLKEADTYLREEVMQRARESGVEPVHTPPFDHEDIWRGHGTLMDEVRAQLAETLGAGTAPDVVACSVGGGGLFNGILERVRVFGGAWDDTTTVGVETQGAHSLAHALEARQLATLPGITSRATSLGCVRVAAQTYALATEGIAAGHVRTAVLTDAEAAMGCWRFADDERALIELACGVTVALCYGGRLARVLGRAVRPEEKVVLVVCGGSNVTTEMVEGWRREFGDIDRETAATTPDAICIPSAATAPHNQHLVPDASPRGHHLTDNHSSGNSSSTCSHRTSMSAGTSTPDSTDHLDAMNKPDDLTLPTDVDVDLDAAMAKPPAPAVLTLT